MPVIEWTDTLALDVPAMDDTHREFVALLNALADAPDEELLAALDAFDAHTDAHFAQENRWMHALPFPPVYCHEGEHHNVMRLMREVRSRVAAGDLEIGRALARELPEWFRLHASTMDAVLAQVIKLTGYAPEREAAAA